MQSYSLHTWFHAQRNQGPEGQSPNVKGLGGSVSSPARRSTCPNLLPRCIVTDGGEKHADADCDRESNQNQQANGYEKSSEDFPSAIGDRQHGAHSVLAAGTPRNITEGGYGWAEVYPKVRGSRNGPQSASAKDILPTPSSEIPISKIAISGI